MRQLKDEAATLQNKIDGLKAKQINSSGDLLDAIRQLGLLENNNENRQRLREAFKRLISRISILPVKLGILRRSPIACLIEIEFHSGARRRILQNGKSYFAANDPCPSGPSLFELVDVREEREKLKRFVELQRLRQAN